jgi:hypothetical protein
VAFEILELAESLHLSVEFHMTDPDLLLLRPAIATITTYMFFNRGECDACALHGDIVVDNSFVTLLLRQEKRKKTLGAGLLRFRHIPYNEAPRFAALL